MYCIGLIKPRNTRTLSPKSLSLFFLSLQLFSMPQEQETLGFLAGRQVPKKAGKQGEALAPPPLCRQHFSLSLFCIHPNIRSKI